MNLTALFWKLTILLAFVVGSVAVALDIPQARHDIESILDQQVQAWNEGNIDKFMEGYEKSDSLRFASGATITYGWVATLERYKKQYSEPAIMGKLDLSERDIKVLSEDAAVVFGRWKLVRESDSPSGLFTLIFRKSAAGWRIVHDHTSSLDTVGGASPSPSPGGIRSVTDDNAVSLFDGKTLEGWKISGFGGHGDIQVKNGQLLIPMGVMLSGVTLTNTNALPVSNYEISLDAMKVDGSDFFCGLTIPVRDKACTFILGGWGGGVVGISSIDSEDASMNETTKYMQFEKNRWYHVRVRVSEAKIEAWIDQDKMVDFNTTDHNISMRIGEIELSQPLGIATWQTSAAFRNIRLSKLKAEPKP